jgi:hypothetical protein
MTDQDAQGGDILAWLDHAISERERMAQESVEQATVHLTGAEASSVSVWRVIERPATGTFVATSDQWDRVAEVVPTYGGAHAEHIAANDPASVLRRCAADRKLMKLHGGNMHSCPATDETDYLDEWTHFGYEDLCPVIRMLTEGYGWTADA